MRFPTARIVTAESSRHRREFRQLVEECTFRKVTRSFAFVPAGPGSERRLFFSRRGKSAFRGRLIVLTDRGTHSAAELFARSVQETGRGIVVGQQSGGEVLGATHVKLPKGFDLHIAIYDYQTSKGTRLEGRGVQPNEWVGLTVKDFRENKDAVLDRVNQLLQLP